MPVALWKKLWLNSAIMVGEMGSENDDRMWPG
jgi:hypothetical protein